MSVHTYDLVRKEAIEALLAEAVDNALGNSMRGKTILWEGTSIPFQFQPDSYPDRVCAKLGATCINKCISGSSVTFFTGGVSPDPAVNLGLAGTSAEHIASGYSDYYSFDRNVLDYLSLADYIIFDHGINDNPYIPSRLGTINSTDKGTYHGAINFMVRRTLELKPTIRWVFTTPVSVYAVYGNKISQLTAIRQANIDQANKWGFSYIDYAYNLGLSAASTTLTTLLVGDTSHPTKAFSDTVITDYTYKQLLKIR